MFQFNSELVIQRMKVQSWELNYCLFQAESIFAARAFLQQMFGPEYDVLPLMHPIRFPQSMFCDYRNIMGKGRNCLYLSSPRRHYYQFIAPSFEHWLSHHLDMLQRNHFLVEDDGSITAWLNMDEVFKDYIKLSANDSVWQPRIEKNDEPSQSQ